MTRLQITSPGSPGSTASKSLTTTIRDLSTAQRSEWIERIFARLAAIYGKEFAYKWGEVNVDEVKATWADALAGFDGEAIKGALTACEDVAKCPNLPEFKAMCRQAMQGRPQDRAESARHEPETPIDRAKVINMISEVAARFSGREQKPTFEINRIPVTQGRRWAYALIVRESEGDPLLPEAAAAWRDVFGFSRQTAAENALATRTEIDGGADA